MDRTPSIHERRRRAPLHFAARAENARFAAFVLWSLDRSSQEQSVASIGYGGQASIALDEGYRREASLALELIIKAVIAARIERGIAKSGVVRVRPTHDLESLWGDAELPALQRDDLHRLMLAKRVLYWSGRYAAPLKDADYEREQADMQRLAETEKVGKILLYKPRSFSWDDFDRIYKIASASLSKALGES